MKKKKKISKMPNGNIRIEVRGKFPTTRRIRIGTAIQKGGKQ